MNKKITPYILLFLTALLLFSCKSAKLSDAEEKQRIGEYFEAAAIYRKVYTKTSPQKRDLRGYIGWLNVTGLSITLRGRPVPI